jgi:phage I-like protein
MQRYAVDFSQELVQQGVAEGTQTYYNRIDAEMRKRFPESFETSAMNDIAKTQPAARTVSRPPVATAARTNGAVSGARKVVLTATEAAAARKIGVPLEEYAKYVKRG